MPKPKSKKAAKKKPAAAAQNRSKVMTDRSTYRGDDQQIPEQNVPGEEINNPPAALTTTAPAPRAIDGEVVPHPADLDPHSLVDMRIRHDPRHLGDDAQLMPTTDTNYMYVRLQGKGIPYKEPPKNTEPGEPADTVEATYPAEEEEETKS